MQIGAHVDQTDPIAEAAGPPRAPGAVLPGRPAELQGARCSSYPGGAEGLRADAEAAGVDLYVHAPYIINVATTNNRIRIPSRKLLQQHVDAAASIGAKGLIVHGGHVDKAGDDPELLAKGFDNWRKAIEATDLKVPLLIENTAGGEHAMTRHLDRIARVWEAISTAEQADQVGFCLDTCHAHAGGNALETVVADVRAITGRIDLVHGNDSRDDFDSGADRHANFGAGRIDPDLLASVVRDAGGAGGLRDPRAGRRAPRRLRLAARAPVSAATPAAGVTTGSLGAVLTVARDPRGRAPGLPARAALRQLPADPGLGPGQGGVAPRVAGLVRRRPASWSAPALVLYRQLPKVKRYLAYLPEGPVIDWADRRPRRAGSRR